LRNELKAKYRRNLFLKLDISFRAGYNDTQRLV